MLSQQANPLATAPANIKPTSSEAGLLCVVNLSTSLRAEGLRAEGLRAASLRAEGFTCWT